jgi:hypothetical protein
MNTLLFTELSQALGVTLVELTERFSCLSGGLLVIGGVLGNLGVTFSSSNLLEIEISPALLVPRTFTACFCGVGEWQGEIGLGEAQGDIGEGDTHEGIGEVAVGFL